MTTIVLGISPRAAEALERQLHNELPAAGDRALLDLIDAELASQLRNPTREAVVTHTTDPTVDAVAREMAAAGAAALNLNQETPAP